MELRTERKFLSLFPAMGRVQDRPLMERLFEHYRPQVVFHAAACKHVPMVELNPWEAVYNNVVGSQVIMDTAEKYGVERCVFISTDKAVRPTNVMGASKRTVEVLLQSRPVGKTLFMAVRFGNVVGSSGSAIPLFQSQIKAGGPVTVTDPEMTRYFMTIPEATQLVLQAGALGEGGEIFILEMGTPVRIADMARDLIRLSGKEPDRDIKIVYTGLRPGEKLYEELITHGEGIVPTQHEKIMVLRRSQTCEATHPGDVRAALTDLIANANAHDAGLIRTTFKRIVPEYTPSDTASVLCAASRFTDALA
jgi:FlaA1/EpsC-like NDP-sugar epimerase